MVSTLEEGNSLSVVDLLNFYKLKICFYVILLDVLALPVNNIGEDGGDMCSSLYRWKDVYSFKY